MCGMHRRVRILRQEGELNHMKKPRIGITASCKDSDPAQPFVQDTYIDSIRRAGGEPILLYYNQPAPDLSTLDGILFSGGVDIEPALYGCDKEPECGEIQPWRDAYELPLCRAAVEADLPVMGICRGAQVINVALGGTLIQHLPKWTPIKHDAGATHAVKLYGPSLVRKIAGTDHAIVNSFHHQAAAQPAPGLAVTAVSEGGTVEALEDPTKRFLLATQWHPERMTEDAFALGLFEAFVGEAAK